MNPAFIIHHPKIFTSPHKLFRWAHAIEIYRRHLLIYKEKLVALSPKASALTAKPRSLYNDGMSDTRLEPRSLPALREITTPYNRIEHIRIRMLSEFGCEREWRM